METIGDRVGRARRRGFVGRKAELDLVRAALVAVEPLFSVLFVHGPGGVGKTALLDAFGHEAETSGARLVRVDGRTVEPTGDGVRAALGVPEDRRTVVLVDTYEAIAHLDGWFRDVLVPGLPARTVVVIAGRTPPPQGWTADIGWRGVVRVVSLPNLPGDDARALLSVEGVPAALHDRVLATTHGHPLALTLLAEVLRQDPEADVDLRHSPDVVRRLVERFAADVPDSRHREALHVCVRARHTTESLLARVLGAPELFAWLRGLSFVKEGPLGVYPHDLVRDVMDEDLRWREPGTYYRLSRAIRVALRGLITATRGREQHHWIAESMYLMRSEPLLDDDVDWSELGQAYADDYEPQDRAAVLATVARHEGAESAAVAARWLDHEASTAVVVREPAAPEPVGFALVLDLHRLDERDAAGDPAVKAVLAGLPDRRPGDQIVLSRYFMDRHHYQGPSAARTAFMARQAQHLLNRPHLAFAIVICRADSGSAITMLRHFRYVHAAHGDFELAGHAYVTYYADCREFSPEEWLVGLADPFSAPPGMDKQEFTAAVRKALREFCRADLLAGNPLMSTRLAGEVPDVGTLQGKLRATAELLAADPREEHLFRAVDRTFLRPVRNQEAAAEILGLPFSTYRRHLTRGVERMAALLWNEANRFPD